MKPDVYGTSLCRQQLAFVLRQPALPGVHSASLRFAWLCGIITDQEYVALLKWVASGRSSSGIKE